MPEIELVDLKDSYFRKRMKGHFSSTLIEQIRENMLNEKTPEHIRYNYMISMASIEIM